MTTIPIGRMTRQQAEAVNRCAEIRAAWLDRPENYPPPARPQWTSARSEIEAHHQRWQRSQEKAHCDMILRDAFNQ
jgi:hypothetical protein